MIFISNRSLSLSSFVFPGLNLEPPSSLLGAAPSQMFWAGPCQPPPVQGRSRYPGTRIWPALAPALQAAIRNMSEISLCWLGLLGIKKTRRRKNDPLSLLQCQKNRSEDDRVGNRIKENKNVTYFTFICTAMALMRI